MISYSNRAMIGLAHLYRSYNDIDIFVEDTTCRNAYEALIGRMIGENVRVERIFQLGGRKAVIEKCREDTDSTRKKIYIIDGDIDVLTGKYEKRIKNLYQLKEYCFENLIIDEYALIEVLSETLSNTDRRDIEKVIRFHEIRSELRDCIYGLFVMYALLAELNVSVPTVNFPLARLCYIDHSKVRRVDAKAVRSRIRDLMAIAIKECGANAFREKKARYKAVFEHNKGDFMRCISGKSYIIPLIIDRCRALGSYKDNTDSLKVRLSKHCRLDVDGGLLRIIKKLAKSC
jgi:hypothetical protein